MPMIEGLKYIAVHEKKQRIGNTHSFEVSMTSSLIVYPNGSVDRLDNAFFRVRAAL